MDPLSLGSRGRDPKDLPPLSYMRSMSRADLLPPTLLQANKLKNASPPLDVRDYRCQNVCFLLTLAPRFPVS